MLGFWYLHVLFSTAAFQTQGVCVSASVLNILLIPWLVEPKIKVTKCPGWCWISMNLPEVWPPIHWISTIKVPFLPRSSCSCRHPGDQRPAAPHGQKRLHKSLGYPWDMEVSYNGGSPKWMVYSGKSYLNGWFGGIPFLGNHNIPGVKESTRTTPEGLIISSASKTVWSIAPRRTKKLGLEQLRAGC